MEMPNVKPFAAVGDSESSGTGNLQKSSSQLDPLRHLELKKRIEAEDRGLTDSLLDQILSSEEVSENHEKIDKTPTKHDFKSDDDCFQADKAESVDPELSNAVETPLKVDTVNLDINSNTPVLQKPDSRKLIELQTSEYRCPEEEWSADEETSSSSSDSSDSEAFFETMREGPAPRKIVPIKSKGELNLEDLPPIEDLVISVSEQEMELIGKVYAIVDKLVVVRAIKDLKPLDLDTVLFLSYNNPLGRIFDVFGPVVEPFYSVRFNNDDHIKEKGVTVDAFVYFAPKKDDITSYVFVDQLQNQKGSDASWKDNNEPPEQYLDYSDDEQERDARRRRATRNRNQSINGSSQNESKRPHLDGDSSDARSYIPPPRAVSRQTAIYSRPNPFMSPRPYLPSPQMFLTSPAPSPFNMPRNNMPYPLQASSPISFQQPSVLPLRTAPTWVGSYQRQLVQAYVHRPVFGQLSALGPVSPALHPAQALPSPILGNVPTLIPAVARPLPQNYFPQRFVRSPSPGPMSPDPWLPNRAPYQQAHLPPNAPLTVQIPPSSPTLPVHSLPQMNGSVQPFIGTNFRPALGQQQRTFQNGMNRPHYY